MSDLIDRQAVINTEGLDEQIRCEMCRNPMRTDRGCDGNCKYDERLYERIMQILGERINPLSSVQPEPCSDAISRQGAIDICNNVIDLWQGQLGEGALVAIKNAINNLPSAQPERQKGEWIDYTEDGYVECPFCHSATNCDGNKDELHFCFSCGADMRGKQDE